MSLEVGPSSRNDAGLSAAIRVTPRCLSQSQPLVDHEVTREAIGGLNDDRPHVLRWRAS